MLQCNFFGKPEPIPRKKGRNPKGQAAYAELDAKNFEIIKVFEHKVSKKRFVDVKYFVNDEKIIERIFIRKVHVRIQ